MIALKADVRYTSSMLGAETGDGHTRINHCRHHYTSSYCRSFLPRVEHSRDWRDPGRAHVDVASHAEDEARMLPAFFLFNNRHSLPLL